MTFPKAIARFSRDVINPVIRHVAGRLPPFSLLEHRGRKSGRDYQTPIMVFPPGNDLIVALTYGPTTDWAQNVIATGCCGIEYRHRHIALTNPRIVHQAPSAMPLPWLVQRALELMTVSDFLLLERVDHMTAPVAPKPQSF